MKKPLLLEVGLDERDLLGAAAGETQVRSVSASTGKRPQVAPYSGAMLPMVARSASGSSAMPGP
jgi:hypothetical protein